MTRFRLPRGRCTSQARCAHNCIASHGAAEHIPRAPPAVRRVEPRRAGRARARRPGANVRRGPGGTRRGRTAVPRAMGDSGRRSGARARGRARPGARTGRMLRPGLDADRHGAHLHRARARGITVCSAERAGRTPRARDRSRRDLRRRVDAKAADLHGPHRARIARRRHRARLGGHEPAGLLRARGAAAGSCIASGSGRGLGATDSSGGRPARDPHRRQRPRGGGGRRGLARRAGAPRGALSGSDRAGGSARDRGDRGDAGRGGGASGGARGRSRVRAGVGHRPAQPGDAQPDRPASRAARRSRRGGAGTGGGPHPGSVPGSVPGGRPPARPRPRAQPPARHAGGGADRVLDCPARAGAGGVELARPGQRGSARAHAGLRPGQCAGLRLRFGRGLGSGRR